MNRIPIARINCVTVLLLLLILPLYGHTASDRLLVFAAASLKNAMDDVATAYEADHDGSVKISYAGSSTLARQIQQGAPAQVYVSANQAWMDKLSDDGLIDSDSRIDLLRNSLVLVTPADSDIEINIKPGFDIIEALGDRPLAMANTDAVPAGIYGRQALGNLDVWQTLQGRVAQAADVRAALALVARGEARLGVVYSSDAVAEDGVRVIDGFPQDSHDPIIYPAAIITDVNNSQVKSFVAFLQSDTAGKIFRKWGFKLADGD